VFAVNIVQWRHYHLIWQAEGVEHPILFVDTEGFSAPDRAANYDSKIFASAALLSSHLLYNSVRIIDQREIEHLEVLTRLTQLFGVKTALQDNSTAMHFPGLTWVVEDFVQEMEDGQTPKAWLESLLEARTLGDGAKRGLKNIFASIDCKTMFLPTLKGKRMLAHLGEAAVAKQLTPEYVEDLTALSSSVITALKHKESLGHIRSGAHTAALLKLLVQSANTGTLAEVPSMWEAFLKLQVREAVQASIDLQMKRLTEEDHRPKPLTTSEYRKCIAAATKEGLAMYSKMLVGLDSAYSRGGLQELEAKLGTQGESKNLGNKERIREYIERETAALMTTFVSDVGALQPIPMASAALEKQIDGLKRKADGQLTAVTKEYSEVGKQSLKDRRNEMEVTISKKKVQNDKELNKLLEAAKQVAMDQYDKMMRMVVTKRGAACVTDSDMASTDASAAKQALDDFEAHTGVAKEEKNTPLMRDHTKQALRGLRDKIDLENGKCILTKGSEVSKSQERALRATYNKMHGNLPMVPSELAATTKREKAQRLDQFDAQMKDFLRSHAVRSERANLVKSLDKAGAHFHDANTRAVQDMVSKPLDEVKDEVERHLSQYWTQFGLRRFARNEAKRRITKEGTLSADFMVYLDEVVEMWIMNDLKKYTDKLTMTTYLMYAAPILVIAVSGFMLSQKSKID